MDSILFVMSLLIYMVLFTLTISWYEYKRQSQKKFLVLGQKIFWNAIYFSLFPAIAVTIISGLIRGE